MSDTVRGSSRMPPNTCHHAAVISPAAANLCAVSSSLPLRRNVETITSVRSAPASEWATGCGRRVRALAGARRVVVTPCPAHQDRERGPVAVAEDPFVGVEHRRGREIQVREGRPGELHRGLRAGRDHPAVGDRPPGQIQLPAGVPAGREILGRRVRVCRLSSSKPAWVRPNVAPQIAATGTPASMKAAAVAANTSPPPASHIVAPGRTNSAAVRPLPGAQQHVRDDPHAAHRRPHRVVVLRDRRHVELPPGDQLPVRSSTRRWPTSQSAIVSYTARCTVCVVITTSCHD